jgi:hypothetical protein
MEPHKTAIERAFDSARSGACCTNLEIRKCLKEEGYNQDLIEGRSLLMQLRTLISAAKKMAPVLVTTDTDRIGETMARIGKAVRDNRFAKCVDRDRAARCLCQASWFAPIGYSWRAVP